MPISNCQKSFSALDNKKAPYPDKGREETSRDATLIISTKQELQAETYLKSLTQKTGKLLTYQPRKPNSKEGVFHQLFYGLLTV
jgi:hypothetical protein